MKQNLLKQRNLTWFNSFISREERQQLHGHKGAVIWFTGLSASGKSTLAHTVDKELFNLGCSSYVLDGDNIRYGLCGDLGFSNADRTENIRRIGELAKLFVDAGIIVLTAFISPYQADRDNVRSLFNKGEFFEIYVNCPIDICARRDQKGLYKKASEGIIKDFTGISAPYEAPKAPELVIQSDQDTINQANQKIINLIRKNGIFLPSMESHFSGSHLKDAAIGDI